MEPVATYVERRLGCQRVFRLFPDRIHIKGATLNRRFDVTVPLANLQLRPQRVWAYRLLFLCLSWIFLLAIIAFFVCAMLLDANRGPVGAPDRMPGAPPPSGIPLAIAGGVALFTLVMAALSSRKIEFARFVTDPGVPVVDIGRSGKQAKDFDHFVGLVVEQIRLAREPA